MRTITALSALLPVSRPYRPLIHMLVCLLITIAIYCCAFAVSTATAATYYVDDANGIDTNTGDSFHPWKTINKAVEGNSLSPNVVAGDTVYIRSGTYAATTFNYIPSPEPTSWTDVITYKAATGHHPKISSGTGAALTISSPNNTCYRRYLVFDGIDMEVTGTGIANVVYIKYAGCVKIQNATIKGYWDPSIGGPNNGDLVPLNNITRIGILVDTGWNITSKNEDFKFINLDVSQAFDGIVTLDNLGTGFEIRDCNVHLIAEAPIEITYAGENHGEILIQDNHFYNTQAKWQGTDYSHGAIDFHNNHTTVRGNIIHAMGRSYGIGFYPDASILTGGGYKDLLIENNMVYDTVSSTALGICTLGDGDITVRNNTFIGGHCTICSNTYWDYYGGGLFSTIPISGTSGAGLKLYNNIFWGCPDIAVGLTGFTAHGNIIYAVWDHNPTPYTWDATNEIVHKGMAVPPVQTDFITNFFTGINSDDYVTRGTDFVRYPSNGGPHGIDYTSNFALCAGSQAVNYGIAAQQPSIDILGNARDANHHSAGCYEYISAQTYTLNTTAVNGTVAKSPDKANYNSGDTVTLTATPNTGYNFANWSGDVSGTNSSVTITMNSNKSVTANFAVQTYMLSITATNGSVTKTPDKTSYNYGDTVTLTATPNTGYNFANWSGDASGSSNPVTITMNTNKSVTANFNAIVDNTAPSVTGLSPAADSIQMPLDRLVILHVADNGDGVDANSVTIKVNDNIVYTGDTADYNSSYGRCHRTGAKADYTFIYQPHAAFDYDQKVSVVVNAQDLAGNAMSPYSYSFVTETRSFGENKMVNSSSKNIGNGHPATVRDSAGNIWVAWHAGAVSSSGMKRGIYVGKLPAGADNFGTSVREANNTSDRCNAALAIDAYDKLYLVWQDNRLKKWDIYMSTSVDGINWSTETKVTDSDSNAVNPVIAVDHSLPPKAYITWQDDRAGNQEIYIASSSDGFATKTISRITSDSSDHIKPAIAVDSANTVYVVWADSINGSSDIYGAASNNGHWANVPIVTKPGNQTNPAIATEATGTILHLLWVDDTAGNKDIYYAASNGLPETPLAGRNIVDDNSGADQLTPVIITTGSTGAGLRVFACWQDMRNIVKSGNTALYFVEVNQGKETNISVGNNATSSNQSAPVIGVDRYGYPYLVWVNDRNQNTDIYYAGSTFVHSNALVSQNVSPASDAIVGTEPANITGVDDVSVVVPAGAYPCELNITISKVENPPKLPVSLFTFPYEFGPSGTDFNQPVTIIIPYSVSASNNPAFAYWYNTLADALSQQGITNVETIAISPTLYAIRFKATHFTQFIVGGSVSSSIKVTKCTITAGSKDNSDKISISGKIDATADNFNDATAIEVTVDSNDMVNPCVLTFPINSKTLKKDKYNYSGTENGVKKSFKYNVKTHSFVSAANNVNLSGLDCPLTFDINVGDYIGTAEVNETIVNGHNKPIPIILLMGVKYSLKVDKCQVKPGNKKPNTDQLLVKGSFTVEDTDVNMANRVREGLVVILGTQTFTIPTNELKAGKGKFTCSKAEVTGGGIAMASFDFNKCSFMLTIRNTNITASSGTVDFGVAFTGYSQIRQITLM